MPRRTIQIESSTACNARCSFCPRSDMTRPRGEMPDALFRRIVAEGKAMGVRHFTPFLHGEPLAFPRLFGWLDHLEAEGMKASIYTNASLLTRDKADRLARNKAVALVHCGLGGATAGTHRKVTGLDGFEETAANVRYLISKAPSRVRVGMVVTEDTAGEAAEHRRLWGRRAKAVPFRNWAGARRSPLEAAGRRLPCKEITSDMCVLWDGRVALCCMGFDGKAILGDLNRQSLREVWDSGVEARRRAAAGDLAVYPLCEGCNGNVY